MSSKQPPTGALPFSAVENLAPTLLALRTDVDDHQGRLEQLETQRAGATDPSPINSSVAFKLTVSGKAVGSAVLNGEDAVLDITELSVTKDDVGLTKVDNTSDEDKPVSVLTQRALNTKAPLNGAGVSGVWGIDISGVAASAAKLAKGRRFSMSGVVSAAGTLFDGSGNVKLKTTIAKDALSIDMTKDLRGSLDSKLDKTAASAAALRLAAPRAFAMSGVIHTKVGVKFDGSEDVVLTTVIDDNALSLDKVSGLKTALESRATAHDAKLTGVPTAPTADIETTNDQLANAQFVAARIARDAPNKSGAGAKGTWSISIEGNASSANKAVIAGSAGKLATPQTIALSGVIVSEPAKFDGSAPVVLKTSISEELQSALNEIKAAGQIDAADTADSIVRRTKDADLLARQFHSSHPDQNGFTGAFAYRVNNTTDPAIRFCKQPVPVVKWLGLSKNHDVAFNSVTASRFYAGYDSGEKFSFSCSNWFRSSGNTGWMNTTWGGGLYMSDAKYVRTYNQKALLASDFVIEANGQTTSLSEKIKSLEAQLTSMSEQMSALLEQLAARS